jgi:hypothetical protein
MHAWNQRGLRRPGDAVVLNRSPAVHKRLPVVKIGIDLRLRVADSRDQRHEPQTDYDRGYSNDSQQIHGNLPLE